KDNDAAKSVSMKIKDGLNQVKGFVGVLALKDKKWMPAVDVLTSMKVDDNASKVTIKGEVSKSVIEKLEKMIKDAKQ
ncbi:hypothetical protein ABI013_15310, partial [Enterococcus faecium]|uniref:hypothetical protein n=1 Tax=Enterococcus faecium TaxID=1352 RepID=UPI003F42C2D6